jgi:hypothetical protein
LSDPGTLIIRPVGSEAALEQGRATLRLKHNLAGHLAASAALFARQALALEKHDHVNPPEGVWLDHRSYCMGAVVGAATFLEAAINELYLEAIDRNNQTFEQHMALATLLEHVWGEVEPMSALAKYQVVLTLAGKPAFPKGEEPYQAIDALIRLRNAVVHFKPEWDSELEEHRKLELRLKDRFPVSPFARPGQAYFPNQCLGHGCAAWALTSSVAFWHDFMARAGLPGRDIIDPSKLVTA